MEGTPDVDCLPASKRTTSSTGWGIFLCLLLTAAAMWLSVLPVWPFTINGRATFEPVMVAIVLGMVVGNIWALPKWLHPGVKFSVKKLLPLGIIFLGARLDFSQILQLGFVGLAMSCFEIVMALVLMFFLTRWLKLSGKLGTLLGIGTAICGGTAIVATAPVIEAEEGDMVFGVGHVEHDFSLPVIAQICSNFFIVMSMAGVGLETKFSAMRQTGWRPFFAAAVSALVIASVILGLIRLLHIS
jgi:uncharacterized membrane protein YadS